MNELTTPQSSPLRHIVNEDKMSSPPTNILTSPIAGKKRKQPDPPTESDDIVENTKKASTAPTPTPTPSMSTSKLDPEPDSNQDKQKGEKQEQEQETVEKFKISNEEDVDKSVKDGSKDTIMEDASITEKQPDSKIQSSGDVAMKEPEKSGDVAMKDVDEEKTGEEQKIHQDIPDKEDTTPKVIPKKPEKINWIDIRAKLLSKDSKLILKILSELRDNFELLHSEEYPTFLATLLPVFDTILKKLPYTPSNQIHSDDSSSSERSPSILESNQCSPLQSIHLIRYSIVELCSVLPHNEILRPFAAQIMKMVLEVLRMDYEEIAFIASKIISELHKNYRDILSEYAEPYLNFVFMSYRLLKGNVQKNLTFPELSINDNNQVATTVTKPNFGLKAAISFRILTECPLTVFLILQLYPKYIKKNLMQLLPLMMEALGQKPPPPPPLSSMMPQQVKTSKEGDDQSGEVTESQNQHYLETIKKIYYKRARELLTAQVKTLTFVTFLLPRYREQMKKDEDHLASSVLALFQMCPRDAISTRKDLLVALKHIFVTDFRRGFYKHFDLLLDDRVLIGRHKQSEHTHLRVDAYGALATLIPHVCPNLSLIQISRVVHLYSRVLHDASLNLPLKSQMMSVNLLLSLVDTVYKNTESRASMGRDILYRILENLVGKISYLADGGAESIMETEKNRKTLISATNKEVGFFDRAIDEEKVEYYRTKREEIYENYLSDSQESLENVKKLVRLILPGLKNLVFCISHYGVARKEKKTKSESDSKQPPTSNQHSAWYEEMAVQSMSLSEQRLIDKFLVSSLKIVHLFKDNSAESPTTSEHQNALDAIATALAQMDSYTFQRIVGPRVDIIFEAISVNPDTIIIVQKLLIESEHISTAFAICLIKFLMEIIKKDFAGKEKTSGASQALKQMFESFFVSLATCRKNEAALRPHLQSLVAICLRRTTNCNEFSWPGIYLEIIRGLFRSVAGGKFEESYKEILPLLSPLINGLYRIFNQTENVMMRKVLIELCLTVPARLSSLLPHLSLLLRVIVPALRTNEGELINLGLRTLEFWVDNLNAEFLLPILSRDADLFSDLMMSLTHHLRPAPYQYGLLTLRLLGKLGGKNRLFLQQPMDLPLKMEEICNETTGLQIDCEWSDGSKFFLDIPIERAVYILKSVSSLEQLDSKKISTNNGCSTYGNESSPFFSGASTLEDINIPLLDYKGELLANTRKSQAYSAFVLVQKAISNIVTLLDDQQSPSTQKLTRDSSEIIDGELEKDELHMGRQDAKLRDSFLLACEGLLHAAGIASLKCDALVLIEGLMQQRVMFLSHHVKDICRSGDEMGMNYTFPNKSRRKEPTIISGKIQPLSPFGTFVFSGQSEDNMECFIINMTIPKILKNNNATELKVVLSIIDRLVEFTKIVDKQLVRLNADPGGENKEDTAANMACTDIFLENLLHHLCEACMTFTWESRAGVFDCICKLLEHMGTEWARMYEVEMIHLTLFCLKDHPTEITIAEKYAARFHFRILALMYDSVSSNMTAKEFIDDVSLPKRLDDMGESIEKKHIDGFSAFPNSDVVCSMMIGELGSPKSIVRLVARFSLRLLFEHRPVEDMNSLRCKLGTHESTTKRLLFSKSLRNLPVPEQIATIETFTFISKQDPKLLPLSENLVLVFFSELLKMMSVADGEMNSESISNAVIVNKDGYNPNAAKQRNNCMIHPHSSLSHASGLFFRDEYSMYVDGIGRINVPSEIPAGIQVRVSSLILFHTVLKTHSELFFSSEPTSSIGNILPHIVSLLFRSLTSRPEQAVDAAYAGLRDILSLSAKPKDGENSHRLPKNLLQMCIRPVLLNLRDYTKLSIPLLRGLSRLLSLLSSWFSKTLGEKLLEHLQRWTDPDKIMELECWKKGDEPLVAAAIIELFELLPDDSHFVELLVKTTLKLENALPRYKNYCLIESPFRLPLAKYLSKHGEATAMFFVNEHRLKNPLYSDLLQDIIKRPESSVLRNKLSEKKWSNVLLNVCFERPLFIMRAEKGGSSRSQPPNSPRNAADILTMHGINVDLTGQGQKCSTLKKTLDLKMEKLQVEQKNQTKFKDRLEKGRRSLSSATGEKVEKIKKSMINAQKLLDRTLKTLDVVKKEYATAQKEYDTELARTIPNSKRSNSKDTPPSMTFETLELQYQGFCIVETLIENDPSYINEHADIVRAFRWLWRSKGRHIRLLHEDSMPPRFNGESRVLARFLVNIAKTSNDVDILFDLLRIFLQPTSSDFSFVQNFLKETVCNSLTIDQKKRVMQRFYPVIGSEGIEELKVLSIQFLILPMLRKDFESLPTTQGKDNEGHNGKIEGLLDHELTDTFMAEVLLKGVKSRSYGSRLNVELLKLTSLLLNFKGNLIHNQHRDEMIKFIWNLLSSDDIKTKQWACVSVCHFIEVFPVPPINVLQLYATLLRLNNQEARDLTYFALDLLFPVMSGRLSSDSCSKVVQYTIKILYEEGNSLSSLSHVWQIIVNHERMFYYHRDHIITHLISGLNKIGLPPNSPVESRKLSILMIQMLFKWESRKSEKFAGLESKSDIVDKDHLQIFSELQCPESSPSKKIQRLPELQIDKSDSSLPFSLQKAELESIVNFLLRMTFLAATTDKPDQQVVVQEANSLFRKIVKRYPEVQVRDTYFDRVELICIEEYKEMSVANSKKTQQVEQGQPTTTRLTDTSQSSMKKEDTTKIVSNNLLSTCLDIFTIIQQSTPRNNFLVHNEEKCIHILLVCLHHTRDSKQSQLREKVKKYLQALFQNEDTNRHTKETCKTYFESTFIEYALSLSRKLKSKESKSKDEESTMHDAVLFCLDEVEKISARMSNFPDLLVKSLISVADKLSKSMLSMSSSRRIAANSKTPTVSPMVEVFNEAFLVNDTTKSTSSRKSEDIASKSLDGSIEVKCLISCLRLIGRSSVPNHFTNQRQKLMTILHDILEYSTNIKLLLTVTVLIGTWVTTERNVLTLTEMKQFILKLTALEQHGLPEVESQPLFHAVSLVVLTVHPKLQTKDIHATSKRAENTKIEKSIDQSLIACLLVTNKRLRAMVVYSFVSSLFCLPIDNSNITEENINAFSFGSHSPVALMEKLVCTSFESLGHRLWTLVFVDILLLSSKPSQTSSSVSGSNKTSERYITGQIKCESYKNFRCLVKAADDGRLIHAIRILASCDTNLNQNLLDVLMSKAWSLCTENSLRLKMVSFMDKLLICPAQAQLLSNSTNASINTPEKRFQYRDINSIQMMLRAIGKMIPTPMLSIDTLLFLAKNYNCWHEVRRMMETQLTELKKVIDVVSKSYIEKLESAIRRCYIELGESDVWMTMKCDACDVPNLKWATSLDLYGKINNGMVAYSGLIEEMEASFDAMQTDDSMCVSKLTETAVSFVEDRWIALHKEMSQWAVLEDFAHSSDCSRLKMECAWKARDWKKLRAICATPSVVASLEAGDIDVKMSEIFLAIADGKLNEVENLHAQTAQLCLYKWQLLPPVHSGCCAHIELLHSFHRLVDIRESGQIMVETSKHAGRKTVPDLKNLLSAWRHRLPNDHDNLSLWDDIFQWRSHMFTAITTNFHWADKGALAFLHDRPWTAIKMAEVARKQGVPEVALLSLGKVTDCLSMDVTDAFSKLREQILSFRHGSELERTGGLNLVNTTNLEYFDPHQKGELIRLKAEFLDSIKARTKATQAYCHAVQLCPSYAETWMSWGLSCSSLADFVERQNRIQGAENKLDNEKSNAKKIAQYLAQSMGCFLEAIQCESSSTMRSNIPKCLQMLSKDGTSPGLLCSTFEKFATKLPSWVWLSWIPQLLTSLCRIESRASKQILLGIIATYPQAVYFSLRSFYLEKRDQDRSRSSESKNATSGVAETEELMSSLKKAHPSLWISLECILEELIVRFRPSYEEELMTTITALLQRAESQIEQNVIGSGKESDLATVRASFAKTLSRVSAKFFRSNNDPSVLSSSNDERSRKSAHFTSKYKAMFEKDFSLISSSDKDSPTDPSTLLEISSKLKKWKRILEKQIALSPPKLPLLFVSPILSAVSNVSPDLWSGSCVPLQSNSNKDRDKGTVLPSTQSSTSESVAAATSVAIIASRAVELANLYEGCGGSYGVGCASVEIPGQYAPNVSVDDKPSPELHKKMIKFESFVEISRQNDQFVRRIGMVGSDGRTYHFLLQFAVPYWTRTDERTAQLHNIFGHCLRADALSSRRHLWLKPKAVVPIAQRLRMTSDDKCNTSFYDIFADYCSKHGLHPNDASTLYQDECKKLINQDTTADEKALAKVQAYETVCNKIPSNILASAMNEKFDSPEKYFYFQRSFTSQLALNSLLQYAFNVNERSPQKLIFNQRNGQVFSPDFRFSYSNQGFLDEQKAVPFRLTRNIVEFIGPNLINGVFKTSLSSAAAAISSKAQHLQPAMYILSRDDIIAWYLSKSAQREGSQMSPQDLERNLSDRVKKNVYMVQSRMRECTPRAEKEDATKSPIDERVEALMSIAMKSENLVAMPISFSPWL